MKRVYETDWLASIPVFYNERAGKVGYNINEVIDIDNFEFHPEGLRNYLDFGYAVLGQTPVKDVKFLRHSSRLTVEDDGKIVIEYFEDPVMKWIDKISNENDVFDLLLSTVQKWENSVEGDIVIPTSGGFDSRLLNYLIRDKSRIRSFSYGISKKQFDSADVVLARKLSEVLGTKWEWIPLGDYNIYLDICDRLFGVSSHPEGMYHCEFYCKILPKVGMNRPLLSGIIGDAWSGNVSIPAISSFKEVPMLSYSHGVCVSGDHISLKVDGNLLEQFHIDNRENLESPIFRIIAAMRFKIIMLCYLLIVPQSLGFQPWAPFLIPEIALSMLTLSPHRRNNRLWQRELFRKHGLDLENMGLRFDRRNVLDRTALNRVTPQPLDKRILGELFDPHYIEHINRMISNNSMLHIVLPKVLDVPKIGGALRRVGIKDERLKAYYEYIVIRPIENLLKRRCK